MVQPHARAQRKSAQILTAEQGKPLAEARGELVMQHHLFAGLPSKHAVLMVKS